ncbi:MAG: TRAP transporter substrate-binding protein [Calditrichaceae bacterium]|nr:TRAP transporter substrate-binding protein [Calditrichaceae bacterium]
MNYRFRIKLITVVFTALIFLFLFGCVSKSKVTVVKLAHVLDVSHPVHQGMVFMAQKVQEYSKGKMRMDIYPSGQLGAERELIELLQIGSLAMTKVSTAPLESFVPEMKIFGIPYVFRDAEHRWKVLNGSIGKQLLLAGEPFFLRGMCYYDAGSRSFYSMDKPIKSPADLEGLKIRVMKSITAVNMVQALGGSPTPIPWGELYTALQQGVVDGAENNPPSFFFSRHYEVCKYYSLDEHTAVPDILLMSTVIWYRLTDQEREWLQKAVDESVEHQKMLWEQSTDEALQAVQDAGVEIIYPDKKPFLDAVQPMHESYKGTPLYDLIQEIKSIE